MLHNNHTREVSRQNAFLTTIRVFIQDLIANGPP